MHARLLPLFFMPVLLGACASKTEGEFPSLSRRPFESDRPVDAPVVPPVPVAESLPPAIAGRVDALRDRHARGASAFNILLPKVRGIAAGASGAGVGSEGWVNAHLQVSRLDQARADASEALAEMDNLVAAQSDAEGKGQIPSLLPLLEPIRRFMAETVARQAAEIDRLSRLIGQ